MTKFIRYKTLMETRVCETNRNIVECQYNFILQEERVDLEQFLHENFYRICLSGGMISYEDRKLNVAYIIIQVLMKQQIHQIEECLDYDNSIVVSVDKGLEGDKHSSCKAIEVIQVGELS